MKRTVVTLTLAFALFMPATAAFAGGDKGNGPRYTCTAAGGSVYYGVTPGTAKQLERSGLGYVCVRSN